MALRLTPCGRPHAVAVFSRRVRARRFCRAERRRPRTNRSGRRLRSVSTAKSCRSSPTTALPVTGRTRRSGRRSFTSTRRRGCSLKRGVIEPGNADESLLDRKDHRAESEGSDAAARIRAHADREADRSAAPMDRRGCEVGHALGLRAAETPRAAGRRQSGMGAKPDRSVHPGAARARGAEAFARSGQGDAAAPGHLRPDRAAADAAEIDAFLADTSPDAYEKRVDRLLQLAALRRAHGDAVARRGPLRRHARLSHRQPARRCGRGATG